MRGQATPGPNARASRVPSEGWNGRRLAAAGNSRADEIVIPIGRHWHDENRTALTNNRRIRKSSTDDIKKYQACHSRAIEEHFVGGRGTDDSTLEIGADFIGPNTNCRTDNPALIRQGITTTKIPAGAHSVARPGGGA